MGWLSKYSGFIVVVILTILAGFPLFHAGLIPTHDGEYHVIRFYEFYKVLQNGIWYPRWAPDLNNTFGVPLFTFVYPFPNYVAAFFHLLGFSFIDSLKYQMFLALLTGAIFMYLLSKEWWGEWGGVISAIVYTYAPYHFVDIYIRGSVGEVWALGLFPACLWVTLHFIKTKKTVFASLISIFLALIILSHNILALAFFPFFLSFIIFFLWYEQKWHLIGDIAVFVILGLGLSAIFWVPALGEDKLVTGLQIFDLSKNFPELYQLLIPSWGAGIFDDPQGVPMSTQIGVINLFIFFLSFLSINKLLGNKERKGYIVAFLLVWFVVLFVLMLSWTNGVWKVVPLMKYFQFPWRLLSLLILVAAMLGGSIVVIFKRSFLRICVVLVTVLLSISYTYPAYYLLRTDTYYTSRDNFIHGTNSPGNVFHTIWMQGSPSIPSAKFQPNPSMHITKRVITSQQYSFIYSAAKQSMLIINTAYFPGWQVKIDFHTHSLERTNVGSMQVQLPAGIHQFTLILALTMVEQISTWISFVSALILLTILGKTWYSRKKDT